MSDIFLYVDPHTPPMSWEEFLKTRPPYSIALDGYVAEGPKRDLSGPYVNFNHHEGVSRLETRSTCAQVLLAIRVGLFDVFRGRSAKANVWVNDCDEDVCTAWWLLKHHYHVEGVINPAINRLVHVEDMLDTTAGAYPFPVDMPLLEQLAWIYEPYRNLRQSARLGAKDVDEYRSVITDVEHRITKHIMGEGKTCSLNAQYEELGGGPGWTLAKEIGAHAKSALLGSGVKAYTLVRGRADGRFDVVLGKLSPFISHFSIPQLIAALNEAEGTTASPDKWGGGDLIAGSPRVAGSKLSIGVIQAVINDTLKGRPAQ